MLQVSLQKIEGSVKNKSWYIRFLKGLKKNVYSGLILGLLGENIYTLGNQELFIKTVSFNAKYFKNKLWISSFKTSKIYRKMFEEHL